MKEMIIKGLGDLDCDIFLYEPSAVIIDKENKERVKLTPARAMMLDVLCDVVSYGEYVSEFSAEKVVYFLQRLGAKNVFNIDFIPYFYGLNSKGKVEHVLFYLNGSYIKGMSGIDKKPFDPIWIMPDTPKAVYDYLSKDDQKNNMAISTNTKNFLRGFYSNFSLELISSVDYLLTTDARLSDWKSKNNDQIISIIQSDFKIWTPRKARLFNEGGYLSVVLDYLRSSNLISYERD